MQQAQNAPSPPPVRRGALFGARRAASLAILAAAAAGAVWLYAMTAWPALLRGMSGFQAVLQPWRPVPAISLNLLRAAIGAVALFGSGFWILQWPPFRRSLPRISERVAFAPLAGGTVLSLAMLASALVSMRPQATGIVVLAALACSVIGTRNWVRECRTGRGFRPASPASGIEPLGWLAAGALALIVALVALYALAPAVESDELRYHFAALFQWKRDGRMHYLPYQAFSNFPMLGEMLFLYAMPSDSVLQAGAGKLMHAAFLAAAMGQVALLTSDLLRASGSPKREGIPFLAAALFACIPCAPVIAGWGFVDLFVAAYFLGFVRLAGRALARPRRASGTLLGLIAGGAIATKYSMVPLIGGAGAIWAALLLLAPGSRKHAVRLVFSTAAWTLVFGGPWYLRNAAWTGDPFYPLAWSLFRGGDWSAENAAFYASKAAEKGFFALDRLHGLAPAWASGPFGRFIEFLMTPATTLIAFGSFESHPIGMIPLLMLLLGVGGWLLAKNTTAARTPSSRWFAAAGAVSWGFWFLSYQSNRMLLPTLAIAIAFGAASLPRWKEAWPKLFGGVRLLIAAGIVYGLAFFLYIIGVPDGLGRSKADALAVAAGIQDPYAYLQGRLNYFPAAQWLNEQSRKSGDGVLLIGEHRTLYFETALVASDWFDTPQPLPLIRASRDNNALLDGLLARRIGYVFVNEAELKQYREAYFRPRFSPAEYARYEALLLDPRLRSLRRFRIDGSDTEDVRIYRILSKEEAAAPPRP